jgi:integrase
VPSEVQSLQWSQVDLHVHVVRLEPDTTKSEDGRTFPYDALPELHEVIEAQRVERDRLRERGEICPWVFHRDGAPIRRFETAWHDACRLAGCPDRIPHDFRRTAVRNLIRAGVPGKTAMLLTGHKRDPSSTATTSSTRTICGARCGG